MEKNNMQAVLMSYAKVFLKIIVIQAILLFFSSCISQSDGNNASAPAPLEISLQDLVHEEGDVVNVNLVQSRLADTATVVSVRTVPGTALAGLDFQDFSGSVTIETGNTNVPIPITLLRRTSGEDKLFNLEITSVSGGKIVKNSAAVTIYGMQKLVKFLELAVGDNYTCAKTLTEKIRCWGYGSQGRLGHGATTNSLFPVEVANLNQIKTLVNSVFGYTCVVNTDDTVLCWGFNANGVISDDPGANHSKTPLTMPGLVDIQQIALGNTHTCGLNSTGEILCLGYNDKGQLGNNTETNSFTPVTVTGLVGAKNISASDKGSCAVTSDNKVKCWGDNSYGQLGTNVLTHSSIPVEIPGISNAKKVVSGYYFSCALLLDDTAKCWGDNGYGQLGGGSTATVPSSAIPIVVFGLSQINKIYAGGYSACIVNQAKEAKCWGLNGNNGLLGINSTLNAVYTAGHVQTATTALSQVRNISISTGHACATFEDDSAHCWGNNNYGQIGNPGVPKSLFSRPIVFQ